MKALDTDVNRWEELASYHSLWRQTFGITLQRGDAKWQQTADERRGRVAEEQPGNNPTTLGPQVQPLQQRPSFSSGPLQSAQTLLDQLTPAPKVHIHHLWSSSEANNNNQLHH